MNAYFGKFFVLYIFAQRPGLGSKTSLARDIPVKMSTAVVLPVVGMSNTKLESQNEGCCRLTAVLSENLMLVRIMSLESS